MRVREGDRGAAPAYAMNDDIDIANDVMNFLPA